MNLRKISVVLSVFVLLWCGFLSVSTQAFSLSDFSSFGVESMKVFRGADAVLDGKISDGEYGEGTCFEENEGLYFMTDGLFRESSASARAMQESFALLSGNYVYCALRLRLPLERGTVSSALRNGIQSYRVSFSLGLAEGDHPVYKGSLLTNTYYFSAEDCSCVAFSGERIARSTKETSVSSKPLSTFSGAYRQNGVVSSDGAKWDADFYCKNAVLSLEESASGSTLVAEVKIPVEDVLLSVVPSKRFAVQAALQDPSAILCGSFSSSVDVDAVSCLAAGIPSQLKVPDSADGQILLDWMKNSFEAPASGAYFPKVLPIPLHWGIVPPVESQSISVSQDAPPVTTTMISTSSKTSSSPATSSGERVEAVPHVEEAIAENDESIFDSLPDPDEKLPENTEIVYDNPKSDDQDQGEGSIVSSILATISGILLFGAVVVLCIHFRDDDKGNEKKKQDQHRPKKKKNSKKKDERRN